MSRKSRRPIAERVAEAAAAVLGEHGAVTMTDVLVGIRWLDPRAPRRWQTGELPCLAEALQINSERLAEAIAAFHAWAARQDLVATEVQQVSRTPQREVLRFSLQDDPALEAVFHRQYAPAALPERKRAQLAERASRPPELVVIRARNQDWTCHRCGGGGGWLIMEKPGPCCMRCAGLDDLVFLPSGDALLTRRARAKSERAAVVVRFSRTRKQYEREGLLVEPAALDAAEQELASQRKR